MKIAIGIPTPSHVPAPFVETLVGILTKTIQYLDREKDEMFLFMQEGVRTDKNRNIILKNALDIGCDYILWLDTDLLVSHDIIIKYLQNPFDIVGCIYYKRSSPHAPVAYLKGPNPIKPYRPVDPDYLKENTVMNVDGLGFGGMMVDMRVYKAMGDEKWMKYGENYHLPYETEGQLTHDLEFCKRAKDYGFSIHLHTGVKTGHIAEIPIEKAHYIQTKEKLKKEFPKVLVIIPTLHKEIAEQTIEIMKKRAGYGANYLMVLNEHGKNNNFVSKFNEAVKDNDADFYVYAAEDSYPGRNWLLEAVTTMKGDESALLLAFNDGKWNGALASFGMVRSTFRPYNNNIFFPEYKSHYADTELSIVAAQKKGLVYNPNAILMEVDYQKESKIVNQQDKLKFNQRKTMKFGGLVTDSILINYFS